MQKENVNISGYEQNIRLEVAKRILERNAFIHIGGSIALYIHGIYLQRLNSGAVVPDFDLCVPFYTPLTGDPSDKIIIQEDVSRASDADYKENLTFNGIKVDYRVSPTERFELITLNDFQWRVTPLEIIMEAKFRYAIRGVAKHRNDCYEICGKFIPEKKIDSDLPF